MYFSLLRLPDFLYSCISLGKRGISFQLHNFFLLSVQSFWGLRYVRMCWTLLQLKKTNSFSLCLAHLGVLCACFYLINLTCGGVGCCFPTHISSQGVWEALGGSVSAQSVVLHIPGLLDREDELQCGTAPHGWGLGGVLAGVVLEYSLAQQCCERLRWWRHPPQRRSPDHKFI